MRFYKKSQVTFPVYFFLRNPELVPDLESDLDRKGYDGVPMCN